MTVGADVGGAVRDQQGGNEVREGMGMCLRGREWREMAKGKVLEKSGMEKEWKER